MRCLKTASAYCLFAVALGASCTGSDETHGYRVELHQLVGGGGPSLGLSLTTDLDAAADPDGQAAVAVDGRGERDGGGLDGGAHDGVSGQPWGSTVDAVDAVDGAGRGDVAMDAADVAAAWTEDTAEAVDDSQTTPVADGGELEGWEVDSEADSGPQAEIVGALDASEVPDPGEGADIGGADTGGADTEDDIADVPSVAPPAGMVVEWCRMMYPAVFIAPSGVSEEIAAHVYVPGLTDQTLNGPDPAWWLVAQVGYGPIESDPSHDPSSWIWAEAHVDHSPPAWVFYKHDRYLLDLAIDTPGLHDYAVRFSADAGASWKYCDLDGSQNGYAITEAGRAEISE